MCRLKIIKLKVENFRCFENLEIQLHPHCNILVGINGAGKSTILDALAIALGGYLSGFDGIKSNYIQSEDAHFKMLQAGSWVEAQRQFPVMIYAEGIIYNKREKRLSWQRELNGKGSHTTHGNIKDIADYARSLQENVRSGDTSCVLPLIAYYGTDRALFSKQRRAVHKKGKKVNRQTGYVDCITAKPNEKQMMQWFEDMTYIQLQEGKPIAELDAVKKALRQCYMSADAEITDASFRYDVKSQELEVTVYRGHSVEEFPVRMLSNGEKGIISLVADIAYRMAVLNPQLLGNVCKETDGIVLIDGMDLHLHPTWQQRILGDLTEIFPKVQFIVSTHAPAVISTVKSENIILLDNGNVYEPSVEVHGKDTNTIISGIMHSSERPLEIKMLFQAFYRSIDDEDAVGAEQTLEQLKNKIGEDDSEIASCNVKLKLLKVRRVK